MITKEQVMQALSHVQEPDLGKDLVSLGMIENLEVDGSKISFTVVLTTPACPLKDEIQHACQEAIHERVDPEADVYVHFSAQVRPSTKTGGAIALDGVKNIIAVASGKGGVGKSSLAVNLACSLAQQGARVGLLDTDIYGPSVPMMMGIRDQRPRMKEVDGNAKIIPITQYGVDVISIGNMIDEKQAVIWRGPMASSAVKQFLTDVDWGAQDYLIIDLPPGTGDIHLTILQSLSIAGGVIITTPQQVASADTKKGIMMFEMPQLKIPILGIVENMAYFVPDDAPEKKYYIFGEGGARALAEQFEIPFLGEIPIYQDISKSGDSGMPVVLDKLSPAAQSIHTIAQSIARELAIKNAQ